ncbi:PREDICTED: 1-phosphatidylinositol phosphodiesterase-like [Cyprinodon variegatus]|uniref:1-phosphatidylinositol phosphodiesterase-like n=1 Tax=Cyprinodon variegatus TaxID=28743 RepID=UPI0007429B02|nr:PREDICTED: 1-phosphatidylinositol phosphodiesterase-like [Cyprinodon variegatus]
MEIHRYLWILSMLTSCESAVSGFNDRSGLSDTQTDWMKQIPDETRISAIAIPGTHESLRLSGGPLAAAQVWSLEEQLNVGVRYLDIHVGLWLPTSSDVTIRDSAWKSLKSMSLRTVFQKVLGFLDAHSGETVLMKVTLHKLNKNRGKELVKKLIEKFERRIWTKVAVPLLKEVRGKIVFLQNVEFPQGTENHKSYFFESNKLRDVDRKIKEVHQHLCGHYILVTQTVATTLEKPKELARLVNPQLSQFVREHMQTSTAGCVGVLTMDFPSAHLISDIIKLRVCPCGSAAGHAGGAQPGPEPPRSEPGPQSEPGEHIGEKKPGAAELEPHAPVLPGVPFKIKHKQEPTWRARNCHRGR